jgi:DedD protein
VALALLEGRTPPKKPAAQPSSGNLTLQIAGYSTDEDAKQRRDKLVASGVTNAYVEHASSGGKSTYRLRVGPFPSREAAQAAQARLRALGYDNGFIATK